MVLLPLTIGGIAAVQVVSEGKDWHTYVSPRPVATALDRRGGPIGDLMCANASAPTRPTTCMGVSGGARLAVERLAVEEAVDEFATGVDVELVEDVC